MNTQALKAAKQAIQAGKTQPKRDQTKPATQMERDGPTPEQLANGSYDRGFVTNSETNTKAMVERRRDSCIVEKWIRDGEIGFEQPAQRAIADCVTYWARIGEPSVTAQYGERVSASTHGEGHSRQEALDEMSLRKKLVPKDYWEVFENVIRNNEPAGVAGSSFAKNPPQSIASAKAIVGMVANILAMNLQTGR